MDEFEREEFRKVSAMLNMSVTMGALIQRHGIETTTTANVEQYADLAVRSAEALLARIGEKK